MPDRLSPLDVSYLYFEEATTAMHVGGVGIFARPAAGFSYEDLLRLIRDRITFVPRYRQRLRWVPAHLANPVWVDDEHFEVTNHVRRCALPRPGSEQQLRELVARIQSRHLDRDRPLWELYLVEGLSADRFAIISKTHHAMVDGVGAVDITQILLDPSPHPRDAPADTWRPAPEPSAFELVAGALSDLARRPSALVDTALGLVGDATRVAGKLLGATGGVLAMAKLAAVPAPSTPLNVPIGAQRRFATVSTELEDYRRVRKAHGGTVNDVVLGVVSGAVRGWLEERGEVLDPDLTVRALVPVSVRSAEPPGGGAATAGNRVAAMLVDLPVGEPDPLRRLQRVTRSMVAHKESGQAVAAQALVELAGFAPPTLHAVGARAASQLSSRVFNLLVTNVPGPQLPLYAAGARLLAAYPVVPLWRNQALAIGLTSYDGGVLYGLNADRDAMPDLDVVGSCIEQALAELVEVS